MKQDIAEKTLESLVRETEINPADDLRLSFLRSHHEMAGRLRMQAAQVRNETYQAYGAAANGLRLANFEEEKIREEVASRFEELGLEIPALYHEQDCDCLTCDPLEGA